MFNPPVYTLHAIITAGDDIYMYEPRYPVQIVFSGLNTASLLVYGTNNSAVLSGVWGVRKLEPELKVGKIIYSASVFAQLNPTDTARKVTCFAARFSHDCKAGVFTTEKGIQLMSARDNRNLIRYQRAVDGMPQLPHDWSYAQFIA